MRSALWRFRATNETKASVRTWFVTLTLSPQSHFNMKCRASLRLAGRGENFESLTPEGQFAELHRECSIELTRWLKRVRKESGSALRYCLVAEAHKSGLPHYHALVHETDPARPVRSRTLKHQWKLGFSQVKLVAQGDETQSASYVAKYLSKSASSRVRASLGYGHPAVETPLRDSRNGVTTTTNDDDRAKVETPESIIAAFMDGLQPPRGAQYWRTKLLDEHECSEPSSFKRWEDLQPSRRELRKRRSGLIQ